ncbi:MAG: sialate O-acetylesterase, partial [Eubacteriales bacterium]
ENREMFTLYYDDRYVFDKEIEKIETLEVTSYKAGTENGDDKVLSVCSDGENKKVVAVGTGRASITFGDGETLEVKVEPAVINLFLLIGQSNAEGYTTVDPSTLADSRSQCVMCEEGQVYSTYAPGVTAEWGERIGGVGFSEILSVANSDTFVAQSLTSDKNLRGEALVYPLCNLTTSGNGKTGTDGAIAYEWNRLTGEKVWIVNAAEGGSSITSWVPNENKKENNFYQAVELFRKCQDVLDSEIKAGHYTLNKMGYFWLQGCSDRGLTNEQYIYSYNNFHAGLEEELKYSFNGTEKKLDFGGIMMVRAYDGTSYDDIAMNGPRLAQYYISESDDERFENVYLATNLGDHFIETADVKNYFRSKYPQGITYPIKVMQELPVHIAQVHPDVHYRQFGYNELGFDAAYNICAVMNGKKSDETEVLLTGKDGHTAIGTDEEITLTAGGSQILVPIVYPNFASSDDVRIEVDCVGVSERNFVLSAKNTAVSGTTGTVKVYLGSELCGTYILKIA